METFASRKPHAGNAGYVCERKARLGGHIVVYDREAGFEIDAGHRWIVMHEPSSRHIAVRTERQARDLMKALAEARSIDEARQHADGIFPVDEEAVQDALAAGHGFNDARDGRGSRQAGRSTTPTARERAALERFLADPENEPSEEGQAALNEAFGLPEKRQAPLCRNCLGHHWPYQGCETTEKQS